MWELPNKKIITLFQKKFEPGFKLVKSISLFNKKLQQIIYTQFVLMIEINDILRAPSRV